jgi:hypothetical protein
MEQDTQTGESRIAISKLVFGIFLVVGGVAAFLGSIDVWHVHHIARFWPLILIAIGVANEIEAIRDRRGDGGYILIAIGVWMLVGSLHLFDLSFGEAMPIGIAIAGLGIVFHALFDRPSTKGKENDHVGQ